MQRYFQLFPLRIRCAEKHSTGRSCFVTLMPELVCARTILSLMTMSLAQYISVMVLLRTNATYVADIADVIFSRCCQFLLVHLCPHRALVLYTTTALASWEGFVGRIEHAEVVDLEPTPPSGRQSWTDTNKAAALSFLANSRLLVHFRPSLKLGGCVAIHFMNRNSR